jgi:energy-coupling factor transport system ATP-binding protein
MTELLTVENLTHEDLFENISFQVHQEEFMTISGGNNCGKTTLIRILSGEIPKTNTISLYGTHLEDYPQNLWKEITGTIIPQDNASFLLETVQEELEYTIQLFKKTKEEREKTYKDIIKKYKLTKYQKKSPNDLKVFVKLKLMLAKIMLSSPQILLIDNTDQELEPEEQQEWIELLKDIIEEQKIAIIMTISDLNIALKSDKLLIISEKKILLEGSPLEVLEKDNILNKIGLDLPFMMDLSVKLKDYNVVEEVELDMDRMVDNIWK